jgi:hypothetical protein
MNLGVVAATRFLPQRTLSGGGLRQKKERGKDAEWPHNG